MIRLNCNQTPNKTHAVHPPQTQAGTEKQLSGERKDRTFSLTEDLTTLKTLAFSHAKYGEQPITAVNHTSTQAPLNKTKNRIL
jgi:hypothetical protein